MSCFSKLPRCWHIPQAAAEMVKTCMRNDHCELVEYISTYKYRCLESVCPPLGSIRFESSKRIRSNGFGFHIDEPKLVLETIPYLYNRAAVTTLVRMGFLKIPIGILEILHRLLVEVWVSSKQYTSW